MVRQRRLAMRGGIGGVPVTVVGREVVGSGSVLRMYAWGATAAF
jgi:hypothetical protein